MYWKMSGDDDGDARASSSYMWYAVLRQNKKYIFFLNKKQCA